MVMRIFASTTLYNPQKQLKNLLRNPAVSTRLLHKPLLPPTSSSNGVLCKVFNQESVHGSLYKKGIFTLESCIWFHSTCLRNGTEQTMNHSKISEKVTANDETGNTKMKRKKLKGKRAVVRWLKFFRYKKKREFERMTEEEKILYKLRKAKKKETRLVEAMKKIEPPQSSEVTHDPEILTPEEHFYFLKMGVKCKNYVPVGRRGIYQGVILNMHLHWKKHQTLKVVVKTFSAEEVKEIAAELARLSGGIVLDIHEENMIIMYRGKNYAQPPTEIMSPKITLGRKKALDKSKYRDGLRAVRKYIPHLEQDLELLQVQAKLKHENKVESENERHGMELCNDDQEGVTDKKIESLDELEEMLVAHEDQYEEDSEEESSIVSDSEALSDIFETDTDEETDEKPEKSLYLDVFEKFPMENNGESEDFEEHLRQISKNSKKEGKENVELLDLDEIDEIFLRAGSLLKKNRR